jgi:predicted ATPase/class 3 adenylate cyclase
MGLLPTGTVTFLFTDIEGSTRLWEEHPEAMRHALERHDELLYLHIEAHQGHVFKTTGDAFNAAFATAPDALAAAIAAQCALQAELWNETGPVRVRMALHSGIAEAQDGDYYGPLLYRVIRLLNAGHGGQTLLSQMTCDLLADSLPAGVRLKPLGAYPLKDLQHPEPIYQLVHPALPSAFPPPRSVEAFAHNLPPQLTSFIGRAKEMERLRHLLTTTRLLTLTGPGGCGKTRMALQVAEERVKEFTDGVWLVELAATHGPELVPQRVASVLGVREEADTPLSDTLVRYLRAKSLLLIFDTCEHLIDACAQLAETLLRACPRLQILATSREALGITGETAWQIPSLSLPVLRQSAESEPQTLLAQSEAVQLFDARAVAVQPDFALTPQNAPAVAQICTRLDGIPLALELAAARVKALTAEQIAERLDEMFRLLTGGSRTALPRQQTLKAAIDWSYDLLSAPERVLLRRLSVFANGWTLEAAEAVCTDVRPGSRRSGDGNNASLPEAASREQEVFSSSNPQPPSLGAQRPAALLEGWEALDLLLRLVEKSLVQVEEIGDGQSRYRLLETIRQYGQDKLLEAQESEALRERHRDYYLALAEQAAPQLTQPDQGVWLNLLEADHDNLRAALKWSTDGATRLQMAGALWRFWYVRGHLSEGRGWLEGALARSREADTALRAKTLNGAGVLAMTQGDYAAARSLHEQSLEARYVLGDRPGIASSKNNLGLVAQSQGDYAAARTLLEESLALYQDVNDTANVAVVLGNLAINAYDQCDFAEARSRLEESLALLRGLQNRLHIAITLHNLGEVASHLGEYAEACSYFRESLLLRQELGDRSGPAFSLVGLGMVAVHQNDYERAARLFGAAEAGREAVGIPLPVSGRASYEKAVATLRANLDREAFETAWAQGRAMRLEQAIAFALDIFAA